MMQDLRTWRAPFQNSAQIAEGLVKSLPSDLSPGSDHSAPVEAHHCSRGVLYELYSTLPSFVAKSWDPKGGVCRYCCCCCCFVRRSRTGLKLWGLDLRSHSSFVMAEDDEQVNQPAGYRLSNTFERLNMCICHKTMTPKPFSR